MQSGSNQQSLHCFPCIIVCFICCFPMWFPELGRPFLLWPRSNERISRNQENYFKEKVVTLTVQSLILYQYLVDWLTFFETLLKKFWIFENGQIWTCWRHLSKQFCPGAEHLKVKKRVYLREMGIHLHSTAIIYILAHVSTSRWMKSCEIKQKTAWHIWPRWNFFSMFHPAPDSFRFCNDSADTWVKATLKHVLCVEAKSQECLLTGLRDFLLLTFFDVRTILQ